MLNRNVKTHPYNANEKKIIDERPSQVKEIKNYIIFFDEINTNQNINGLFKEILIDKCVNGVPLNKKIVVMAACNPYKLK